MLADLKRAIGQAIGGGCACLAPIERLGEALACADHIPIGRQQKAELDVRTGALWGDLGHQLEHSPCIRPRPSLDEGEPRSVEIVKIGRLHGPIMGRILFSLQKYAVAGSGGPGGRHVMASPISIDRLRVRASRPEDAEAMLDMARLTGGGFTSLPPDRDAVAERLAASQTSCAATVDKPGDESYWLVMEHVDDGRILGCAAIFAQVGVRWPFYNFKRSTISHFSTVRSSLTDFRVLHLTNDFNGATEVAGLFLHPELRGSGAGPLLARSRYMFMAASPQRFADRVMAEMRGWRDDDGRAPFWEAVGHRFFDMPFEAADEYGALHGNQFLADLLPRHPLYEAFLSDDAVAVIGKPHRASAPAMAMLFNEGFRYEGYVDVFDAGPCVACARDDIATIRRSRRVETADAGSINVPHLMARGALQDFVCTRIAPGEGQDLKGALISPW